MPGTTPVARNKNESFLEPQIFLVYWGKAPQGEACSIIQMVWMQKASLCWDSSKRKWFLLGLRVCGESIHQEKKRVDDKDTGYGCEMW